MIRSDKQIIAALSHLSIKLNEDDIPGAKLPKPTEQCTVPVLNGGFPAAELKLRENDENLSKGEPL